MGFLNKSCFIYQIQDTDFIFAVFAEEFGFVGSMVLLALLATFATLGLIVALKAKNIVHRLVAIGVTILMVGQSLVIERLQAQGKTAVIPPKRNRTKRRDYDRDLYKARQRK